MYLWTIALQCIIIFKFITVFVSSPYLEVFRYVFVSVGRAMWHRRIPALWGNFLLHLAPSLISVCAPSSLSPSVLPRPLDTCQVWDEFFLRRDLRPWKNLRLQTLTAPDPPERMHNIYIIIYKIEHSALVQHANIYIHTYTHIIFLCMCKNKSWADLRT